MIAENLKNLNAIKDRGLKGIINEIDKTTNEYIKYEPNWIGAVKDERDALYLFLNSPGAMRHVACAAQILFKGVNENKLSRLYGALACYIDTKALPKDYAEIKKLDVSHAAA